jgi:hypothetical protein
MVLFIMNLVLDLNQLNYKGIFFHEPIKNTVMNDSDFIRIIYSTDYFMMNGIYLKIHLNIASIEKYFNKYKCIFNVECNKTIINELIQIEKNILSLVNNNKIPQYRIKEQLTAGYIKMFISNYHKYNNSYFIVKISGLWETDNDCGLTFKFFEINHL